MQSQQAYGANLRSGDDHKQSDQNNEDVKAIGTLLLHAAALVARKVLHPQQSRENETERRKADGTRQAQEVVENRHRLGNDEGQNSKHQIAPYPRRPVNESVLLQVVRVS